MTATAGLLLLNSIMPLITAAISRGSVRTVGCEDLQELQAEACALAAAMLDSAEARSKVVCPRNIAHYALQALKSGRRSAYAGRRDCMCPAAALDGSVRLTSMDEPVGIDDDSDDEFSLHDCIASSAESPDACAARELDWDQALSTMDDRMRTVLRATAEGVGPNELAVRYKISAPRVCQLKESAADKIAACWGGDPLVDAIREPGWRRGVRAHQERRTCRAA